MLLGESLEDYLETLLILEGTGKIRCVDVANRMSVSKPCLLYTSGLGIPKPNASLGSLINEGFNYFLVYPHMMLIPAIVLAILMLSFNLFGDGLHDALDPTMKEG